MMIKGALSWAWSSRIRLATQFAGGSFLLTHIIWQDYKRKRLFSNLLPAIPSNRFCPVYTLHMAATVAAISYLKTYLTNTRMTPELLREAATGSAIAFTDTISISTIVLHIAAAQECQLKHSNVKEKDTRIQLISMLDRKASSPLAMHLAFGWILYRLFDIGWTFGEHSAALMDKTLSILAAFSSP